jgi:ferritin-like metal-binding protein YciE
MSQSVEQKIVRYLTEAHASEVGLTRDLQAQIAMTPRGGYRSALQSHLRETREHARRVRLRARELGDSADPVQAVVGLAESTVSQLLALGKAPLSLLRGGSGEEKVLKNAKDACASEALEIATYTAIEQLARSGGDELTAELAASIREEEERMLERVLGQIPKLTVAVVGAEAHGESSYELSQTGAADASKEDLAISDYDKLNVPDIVEKLPELSQIELAKIDSYERRNQNRTTVLSKISSLRKAA